MSGEAPTFRRKRAGTVLRLGFKAPVLLYRGPVAELLRSRCVMLLTTVGRKSGLPRTNGVSFMPLDGHYVIFAGWGLSSNWYRNLRANPDVMVQVGRRRIRATARLVEDPDRREELMLQMRERSKRCGPPQFIRPLLALTGAFDYNREIAMAVEHARELPVVEIIPNGSA